MINDSNPGGYKGRSNYLCSKCHERETYILMDGYVKSVDREIYYRCPNCGYTVWDASTLSNQSPN